MSGLGVSPPRQVRVKYKPRRGTHTMAWRCGRQWLVREPKTAPEQVLRGPAKWQRIGLATGLSSPLVLHSTPESKMGPRPLQWPPMFGELASSALGSEWQ